MKSGASGHLAEDPRHEAPSSRRPHSRGVGNFGGCNMRGGLVPIGHGFQNGEAITRMSDASLFTYLEGSIDTLQAAMLFGANPECYAAINACIADKSNQQLAAVVRKYLYRPSRQMADGRRHHNLRCGICQLH